MIQFQQVGNPRPICKVLTTTGVTKLYNPTKQQIRGTLESIAVCNVSGGAVTFTMQLTSPTPVSYAIAATSIPSGGTYLFNQHNLPILTDWALEVQAGTANALHITSVIIEQTPAKGAT
jgi:hypothetical protein